MPIDITAAVAALRDPGDEEYRLYRDILEALVRLDPGRRRGEGFAYQTLFVHLANQHREYAIQDIILACDEMEKAGVLQIKNEIFVHPTEDGEQVLAALFPNLQPRPRLRPFPGSIAMP